MALENILGQFGQGARQIGGLLAPEPVQGLTGLLQNPMFRTGMGILAANQDPRMNVFQGAMSGLMGAQEMQQAQAERERMEELRRQLGQFFQPQEQSAPMQSIYPPMSGQGVAPPSEFDMIFREYADNGRSYG